MQDTMWLVLLTLIVSSHARLDAQRRASREERRVDRPVEPRTPGTPTLFFVNEAIEEQSRALLESASPSQLRGAYSQWMFERSVYMAAQGHPRRTYNRSEATFLLFPFLPVINGLPQTNGGRAARLTNASNRAARLKQLQVEIERAGLDKPVVITCTCVMQGKLFDGHLFVWLQSRHNLIQLAHSTRSIPLSASDRIVVVPYETGHATPTQCRSNGRIYWAGSMGVASRNASKVRKHIWRLGQHSKSGLLEVHRSSRLCTAVRGRGDNSSRCVDGQGNGDTESVKEKSRREMAAAQFCLVPEGDSPDSSRLYDAVTQLCVPVVLSSRIPVPTTRWWALAAVTIIPGRFLKMDESMLHAELASRTVPCGDLMALRRDIRAPSILDRLGEDVRWLMRPKSSAQPLPRFVHDLVGR